MKKVIHFLKGLILEKKKVTRDGKRVIVTRISMRKLAVVLTTMMGIGFGIFFIEEADQKIVYGMFSLLDVGAYDQAQLSLDAMKKVQKTGLLLNNLIGWVNPVCYIGYRMYFRTATDRYIDSVETVIAYHKDNTASLPVVKATDTVTGASPSTAVSQFLDPPTYEGAIGVEDTHKWIGWTKTVIVPVTNIDVREKVSFLGTPTPFKIVVFPSSNIDVKPFFNHWVIVTGAIKEYHGAPELILTNIRQIIDYTPLTEEAK